MIRHSHLSLWVMENMDYVTNMQFLKKAYGHQFLIFYLLTMLAIKFNRLSIDLEWIKNRF